MCRHYHTLVTNAIDINDQRFFRGSTLGEIDNNEGGSLREKKIRFWSRLVRVAFALAPPGYGLDTHRIWEILHMKTVPIVLTSTLDCLYSQFPVIIVNDWKEVFELDSLTRYRQQILDKWGDDPFGKRTMQGLSLHYWVDMVNNHTITASNVNPYLGTGRPRVQWV